MNDDEFLYHFARVALTGDLSNVSTMVYRLSRHVRTREPELADRLKELVTPPPVRKPILRDSDKPDRFVLEFTPNSPFGGPKYWFIMDRKTGESWLSGLGGRDESTHRERVCAAMNRVDREKEKEGE